MEFIVDGITYRATKLNAIEQFHIVRRLAPVIGRVAPLFKGAGGNDDNKAFSAMAEAIAALPDADADYCIFGLLKAVTRKQDKGNGWGAVTVAGRLQYDDITLPAMLQIAWNALQHNLSNFFDALPSSLREQIQTANANG